MFDCKKEIEGRVEFIKQAVQSANADGVVFGNSGGKDSALVGILCKMACPNTLGVIMPCQSRRNFTEDAEDGMLLARTYDIETITTDLTKVKEALVDTVGQHVALEPMAMANMNPRIRMATLYSIAQSRKLLVAGTGNRSEVFAGYFTKWGDGAYDFNPMVDLTVSQVYQLLEYLQAPRSIIDKAPSAALFEGQTDEQEMGVTYAELDQYILTGKTSPQATERIQQMHNNSRHKRQPALVYRKI